jgi:hypothetical protein
VAVIRSAMAQASEAARSMCLSLPTDEGDQSPLLSDSPPSRPSAPRPSAAAPTAGGFFMMTTPACSKCATRRLRPPDRLHLARQKVLAHRIRRPGRERRRHATTRVKRGRKRGRR